MAAMKSRTRLARGKIRFSVCAAVVLLVGSAVALSGCQQSAAALNDDQGVTVLKPAIRKPNGEPVGNPIGNVTVPAGPNGDALGYRYRINYPDLQTDWHAADDAMHAFAETQKKSFFADLAQRPPIKPGDGVSAQAVWDLKIDFTVATETQSFVSMLGRGSVFTGGAHPNPILASFNEHVPSGKVIAIGDLFSDADAALKILSDETRRQLKGQFEAKVRAQATDPKALAADLKSTQDWIDKGTAPTPANFAVFLVDGAGGKAIGLTIIFAPYQVASYADGEPQVEVPTRLFYLSLKPDYRDAFAIDAEDLKRLNAGH